MAKIRVVQIAITLDPDNNEYAQYVDTAGRVWFREGKYVYPPGASDRIKDRKWVTEWKQLELPEEPEVNF